jgi:hypothetical protein
MTFVLMPHADPQQSAVVFGKKDLLANYEAATQTILSLLGRDDTVYLDSSTIGFNCFAWSSSIMQLVEYAEILAKQVVINGWDDEPIETDLSHLISEAYVESDQVMTWPWWVGNESVHEAHRGYLICHDPVYRCLWPSTPAYSMPFPGMDVTHALRA